MEQSQHIEPDRDALAALERAGLADAPPPERKLRARHRGRGAVVNPPVRFDRQSAEPVDDGWWSADPDLADLPRPQTTLIRDTTRTAISWNTSPDIGFDRAVNPYRGCEHGCVYCYARPTHAYLGYSPGLDFETKLVYKPDVAALLEREFRKPGYAPRPLALGSNTDPYQPVERTLRLTRAVLGVAERFGHPVTIVTKSATVLRDLDILSSLAARDLVRVYLSVTTLDGGLARAMEPRACAPARRLQAIEALTRAKVPTGVFAAPMIPGLNDAELESICEAAARAGAAHAGFVLLRLPHELKEIFSTWLEEHFPRRAGHVLSLIRQARDGSLNKSEFHERFTGTGAYAELLRRRFERLARRLGLNGGRADLDCSRFAVPGAAPRREAQLALSLA